jgi:hypothetical protein
MDKDLAKLVQMSLNLVQGSRGSLAICFEYSHPYQNPLGLNFYIFISNLIKITIKWVILIN